MAPARERFLKPPKVVSQWQWTWRNAVTASFFRAEYESTALPEPPPDGLRPQPPYLLKMLAGQWDLPVWPRPQYVMKAATRATNEWAQAARLPAKVARRGLWRIRSAFAEPERRVRTPPAPQIWQHIEAEMEAELQNADDCIIIADDKEADRV